MRYAVTCSRCNREIKITAVRSSPCGGHLIRQTEDGRVMFSGWCPDCKKNYQLSRREEIIKLKWKATHSVNGLLGVRCRDIRREGWAVDSDEFKRWARADELFNFLYQQWRDCGFKKQNAPCVVRIDESRPYGFDNCAWVAFSVKLALHLAKITRDRIAGPTRQRHRIP